MTLIEVQNRLRDLCDEAGSMRKWATAKGINVSYVSQVMRGNMPPSPRLLKMMGLKKEYTFKKLPDYRN